MLQKAVIESPTGDYYCLSAGGFQVEGLACISHPPSTTTSKLQPVCTALGRAPGQLGIFEASRQTPMRDAG